MTCKECGRVLTADELGLNYKLISREAREFLCVSCMARYFSVEERVLEDKIAQFKRWGCQLFSSEGDTAK